MTEAGHALLEQDGVEHPENWHEALYGLLASACEAAALDLVRAAPRGLVGGGILARPFQTLRKLRAGQPSNRSGWIAQPVSDDD